MEYGNFKVRCIKDHYALGDLAWRNGKIYEFKNGECLMEDGFLSSHYKSFEDLLGLNPSYKECLEFVKKEPQPKPTASSTIERPKFKQGDKVVFARYTDKSNFRFVNQFFRIGDICAVNSMGYPLSAIKVANISYPRHSGFYMPVECFDLAPETEEPKYPIIDYIDGVKVVFNPPYTVTIHEFKNGSRYKGLATCHPNDKFDKWEGYKIAYERMVKSNPCTK